MKLLDRLRFFGKGKNAEKNEHAENTESISKEKNENCFKLLELEEILKEILEQDAYIAKSDYTEKLEAYDPVIRVFRTLEESKVLGAFCMQNDIAEDEVRKVVSEYENIEELVEQHNQQYISQTMLREKEYLDHIADAIRPDITLDEDQRKVILTDEDYCMVIAGAGAGKTTTVAAKVKYLVEKKQIDPEQILVVSFTNKAVQELKDKIQKALGIEKCVIATFHSTGNAILRKHTPEETMNIADHSKMYFVLRDYFRGSVMRNESMVNKLILFFASYFDAPYEGDDLNGFFNNIAKANYSTLRSDLEDFRREVIDARTKKSVTIQNEVLRSHQEVEIANFLYLNKIDYEYEPVYPYNLPYARKPYTPDFVLRQNGRTVYLEHFGISEDGKNDRYSEEELQRYKKAVNDKVRLHKKHGTELIYTFSKYKDGKSLEVHLKKMLEEHGFEVEPRSNQEVMELLVAGEENRYVRKLLNLICRFISNFKVNGYRLEDFERMYHSTQNVRSRLFLEICQDCYLEYVRWLKENKAVDFEDMINESARLLGEAKDLKQKLDFKYIIVDEYQDISRQRFDLTKALSEVTDAKIIAVGDDWQSIYAFSGSDITLFTKFQEKMGYAKMLKIVRTYRNSQEVIDIAGGFIQKNASQISKRLLAEKHIEDPVIIYTYDDTRKKYGSDRRSGANYALAKAVETALEEMMRFQEKPGKILLIGRFGFDADRLEKSGLFEYVNREGKIKSVKYPGLDITFLTAHASKGLGYDNVIVVNGKNETYGFPSKIEDDPVLAFVIKGDRSIDYAEERRLFYVAMTRTMNRVYFVAPEQNPSEFLLELKREYKNVCLRGDWNEEEIKKIDKKVCPLCGYPMQLKYKKAYGLRLYLCINEPEICGFMTNDCRGGKLSIQKCHKCRDGYLIVKNGQYGDFFLGCTNYKKDGTGCDATITKKAFYEQQGYAYRPDKTTKAEEPKVQDPKVQEKVCVKEQISEKNDVKNQKTAVEFGKNEETKIQKAELKAVPYKDADLNEIVFVTLNALQNVSRIRYYGTTMLIDILRGMDTERIRKYRLFSVPEYGALKNWKREEVQILVEWMLAEHFMLKTKERYPVLHPTYEGMHYKETISEYKLKKLADRLSTA